ncbi:tripartite tricarboxylate transporter substrate binding protein [Rhodoplanes roseus]|uniref:LacI family transcriptional regulator n=1 Tax=Rhodoplanes roseus TaxID=29409 RepID=A0A327KRX3_9BRAD|nr:tripartite tricarboxylate transporter substrate binding protein [Rhodoplanes roseus]RAI40736.1 LacI family transcriptional regulator [Rhodoplanes roseus]
MRAPPSRRSPCRRVALLLLTAPLLLALAAPAAAQSPAASASASSWPKDKPVRVIVPLTAGSATDVVARTVFDQVGRQLGQTFVIENRPGAAGSIGAAVVAKAEPDGYVLLVSSSSHTVLPSTHSNLPFDVAKDFAAIAPLASIPTVMVVSPRKGFASAKDFVTAAKAKPGQMSYASGGIGNSTHFAAERFRLAAGFDGLHVPFKGAPEALSEVLAGRVDFYFSPVPPALSLIRDGQLEALAVSSAKRSEVLPDVPTTVELGLPDSGYEFWIGAFMPAATPRPIVERLAQEVATALARPEVRERLAKMGAEEMPMEPRAFDAYVAKEIADNAALVKATGLKFN